MQFIPNVCQIYAIYAKFMEKKMHNVHAQLEYAKNMYNMSTNHDMQIICTKNMQKNMQKYEVYVGSIFFIYMQNMHRGLC